MLQCSITLQILSGQAGQAGASHELSENGDPRIGHPAPVGYLRAAARALYRRISDVLAAARKNYDALTDGQKKAVSNAEKMIALEKAWAEVKAPALEALQEDAAFVAELSVSTGMLRRRRAACSTC